MMDLRWLLCAAAACGSSTATTPDAPLPTVDAHPPFVMTGTITDTSSNPIVNARACMLDHPELPCVHTDGSGNWTLDVPFLPPPPAVEIAMSFTAEGYLGFVGIDDEELPGGVSYYSGGPLFDDATATTLLATNAGFTYPEAAPPTTGFVEMRVQAPVGATATLSPSAGSGAVYTRADGTPDRTLAGTQTTDALVYFGNVAPGKYDVVVASPGLTCYDHLNGSTLVVVVGNWPPTTAAGAVALEVAAGAMTRGVTVYCF